MASSDGTAFLRLVMEKLSQFNSDLTEYTNKEAVFSSEVATELQKMKAVLTTTITKLGQDFDRITGAQDPIAQLLTLRNLEMAFDSINSLQLFRSQVASLEPTVEEQDSILKRHLFPVYLSSLPALLSDNFVSIGLGEERKQPLVPPKDALLHSTLDLDIFFVDPQSPGETQIFPRSFSVHDNVHEVLCDMIPRMLLTHLHPDYSAFKVTGTNEYIFGDHCFNEFLAIREAVHSSRRLQVELCSLESPDAHRVYILRIFTFWRDLRQQFYKHAALVLDGGSLDEAILELSKPELGPQEPTKASAMAELHEELRRLNSLNTQEGSEEERHALTDNFSTELAPLQSQINNNNAGRGRGRDSNPWEDDDDGFTGRYSRGRSVSRAPPGLLFQQQQQQQFLRRDDQEDDGDDDRDGFVVTLPNSPQKLSSTRGRPNNNDWDFDTSQFSRFRGQSVAPGANDHDSDRVVLRSLATCKPIDFGVKTNSNAGGVDTQDGFDMDSVSVKKLTSFPTPSRQQEWDFEDEDRYSKRASGVINIPSNILVNSSLEGGVNGPNTNRRSGFATLNFGGQRASQMIRPGQSDSDDDDFGIPRATHGPTSMFNAGTNSGSSPTTTTTSTTTNSFDAPFSRERAGSGFIPFNPRGSISGGISTQSPLFGNNPSSLGSPLNSSHLSPHPSTSLSPPSSLFTSPQTKPSPTQSTLPLSNFGSDIQSNGDYKGTPFTPKGPITVSSTNFNGIFAPKDPLSPANSSTSDKGPLSQAPLSPLSNQDYKGTPFKAPVVDLTVRGRVGGASYKTLRRGSITSGTMPREASIDRSSVTSDATNNTTNSNGTQASKPPQKIEALDLSSELKMNKDITQRRRRSIVQEIALNDSDEEDFGVTQRRTPSHSISTTSQLNHSTTPTNAMIVAAGHHGDAQMFTTVANLRQTKRFGDTHRNLMSALDDIHTAGDSGEEIVQDIKIESDFNDFLQRKRGKGSPKTLISGATILDENSPSSQHRDLTFGPAVGHSSSVGSTSHAAPHHAGTMNRRASIASSPAKNALFKFSTLTQNDQQQYQTSLGQTQSVLLGAFAEETESPGGCGQLFIPALHPSFLQQLRDEEEILGLDVNQESLGFDLVAKHHRMLALSLVPDNTGPAQPASSSPPALSKSLTGQGKPISTTPIPSRPTHHRCVALPILKDNTVLNNSDLTLYNSLSQSHPSLTHHIERPDPLLSSPANVPHSPNLHKQQSVEQLQAKPPKVLSAAQTQRQNEIKRQIDQLSQLPVLDLAHPTQGFSLPSFTLKVHGIDGLSVDTCPRLGNIPRATGERSKLSIVTCILANNTIQRGSLSQTSYIDTTAAPRWGQTILPHPNPTNEPSLRGFGYGEISRHSKIAFVLVESLPSENPQKEISRHIPLAWVSLPVFQETDACLQGTHNLPLWPLSNVEGDLDILGASQHLIDQYNTNGGRIPKTMDKKASKKDEKKGTVVVNKAQLGFSTIINDFDIRECPFVYRGTNSPNTLQQSPAMLTVEFASFNAVVLNTSDSMNVGHYDPYDLSKYPPMKDITKLKLLTKEQRLHYDVVAAADILYTLSEQEKEIIWLVRDQFAQDNPQLLPLFLQSVNFSNPHHRNEALRTLESWPKLTTFPQVIALLDQPVTDYRVRMFAVKCLREFADKDLSTLQLFLLQLTQCLKFEPYSFSPLAEFLLERSLDNPFQIGHFFYWGLKNEMCFDPPFTPRYRSILEAFISFCPSATDSMRTQQHIIDECSRLATKIRQLKSEGIPMVEYNAVYKQALDNLNRDFFNRLPGGVFQIPLDPRWECARLLPSQCRIMSSKMVPLWLTFENADKHGKPLCVMFKAGDDLRQDILTLQILRFLDQIWLNNGMDLCLSPYNVVATGKTEQGKGCGMIQIVLNSTTTSAIHTDYGGGASGAFKEDTIWQFLKEHNKDEASLAKAVDNFVRSCAGYCVATYVLGIGDRHNGNIMATNDGHLFHIDFGHFLGNFKSKFGMNRERAAFVLTSEMVYAMGGSSKISSSKHHFKRFEDYCLRAIDLVRQHANELETLFLTMIGAGMPELIKVSDIFYIREKLCLSKTPSATRELFKKELSIAMNSTSRQIDNFVHNLKHR